MSPFQAAFDLVDNTLSGAFELVASGDTKRLERAVKNAGPLSPLYYWFLEDDSSLGRIDDRGDRGERSERK